MDFNLYYLKRKNNYTLHFLNKKGLSTDEITDIFSEYGTVRSVTCAGNETGMRFVSYMTLKETVACINGLKSDKRIQLLPEREKIKKNENTNDQEVKCDESKQRSTKQVFKSKKCYVVKKQNQKSDNKDDNAKCESNLNEVLSSDDQSVSSRQAFNEMVFNEKKNDNKNSENNESSIKSSEILTVNEESAKLSIRNILISRKGLNNLHDFSYVDSLTHSQRSFQEVDERKNYEISGIISANRYTRDRSMESLNEIGSCASGMMEHKSVIAQHVIVANVHKDASIHLILHLFHDYDPIAVSLMKTIHETRIRYCHVYFKTPQDALIVEQIFDNFPVYGECLIVLRNHSLLEEIKKQ